MKSQDIILPGTRTAYGKVVAVEITGRERYYWLLDRGVVVMMPAFMLAAAPPAAEPKKRAPRGESAAP